MERVQAMRALASLLGLLLAIVAGSLAAQTAPNLSGMSADEIKALQQRLTDGACYRGAVDGQASPALERAIKACPTQAPILRIETGMHTGIVLDVATDSECRVAATASLDKTVRLWSLPDSRLLHTQRFPSDSGPVGLIYGVAVSPDGKWVAAGGIDSHADFNRTFSVYLFDTETGASVRRFDLDGETDRVAFSPDGRRLAVALGSGGVRVLDIQSGRVVLTDRAYGAGQTDVTFGPDGALYAIALDGLLRRYAPNLRQKAVVKTFSGRAAYTVAVQPTGGRLAVTYADAKAIDIYSAADLHWIAASDTSGLTGTNFLGAAWSRDGQRLFAGGQYVARSDGKYFRMIRIFDADGRHIGADVPAAGNTIYALATCGQGAVYVSSDPLIGSVSPDGKAKTLARGHTIDMRGKVGDAFTVSADGKQVRFGLGIGGNDPVLFDLAAGTLVNSASLPAGFTKPNVTGLSVTNWLNTAQPLLNGKPFFNPRDIGEPQTVQSMSLAVRADRTGFVLGMQNYIVAFDAQGKEIWMPPPMGIGAAWGVNLADGDRLLLVAADGMIRWYRWSDGKELLALFIDAPTRRWVAWTPSGYYMASPGGEDLIGWHVNRGWSQPPDFFPASRFRDRFNRPDIVRLVLDTLDEDAAIKQANDAARRRVDTRPLIEHLPPVIRIATPDGAHVQTGTVTLDYAVRSPSGQPVDRLDLVVNGRPVKAIGLPLKPLTPNAETTGSLQVTLTQHVSQVGLIAWSGGFSSQAAQVTVTWDGAPEVSRKLYALVVGVSNYADPAMTLKYAAKDATDFAKALADQMGHYYADVQARVLTDRAVTRVSILEGLEWLEKMAKNPNDVSVLFLAGHGMTDEKQTYWFYTSDSSDDNVRFNGVSQDEIRKSLQDLQGKVLWFLDTCHAGTAAKRPPVDMNVLVNTVSASENGGIVVFASSTGRQVSIEAGDLGNGAFTKAVVEGIDLGKAALGNGFITTSTLDSYVVQRVEEFTGNQQTPVMERPPEEPDFAIAQAQKP